MSLFDHANVTIVGRLTRDAELRYTPNGFAILEFSVASSKRVKKGDGYENKSRYYECKVFGDRAEKLGAKLAEGAGLVKGTRVFVTGDLDQETWDDKQTGQKRSKFVVAVDKVIDFPRDGGGSGHSE